LKARLVPRKSTKGIWHEIRLVGDYIIQEKRANEAEA